MITIQTHLSRNFFIKEYMKLLYGKTKTWLIIGLGLLASMMFCFDLFFSNKFTGYLLPAILCVLLLPLIHYRYAIKFYDSSSFVKELTTYKIDETGVHYQTESANIFLKWTNVYEIKETDSLFLIYENKFQGHYIPKKDMTALQITALQALLKTVKNK